MLKSPLLIKQGRIHDTLSRGGWAGAVMWWAGAVQSAIYTTASVTYHWAGVVTNFRKVKKMSFLSSDPLVPLI